MPRRMTMMEALDFIDEHSVELAEILEPDEIFRVWPEMGHGQYNDSGYPVIMIQKRDRII